MWHEKVKSRFVAKENLILKYFAHCFHTTMEEIGVAGSASTYLLSSR